MENGFRLGIGKNLIEWLLYYDSFNALVKLSRKAAIFEFTSPNGFTSFNIDYECGFIYMIDAGDKIQNSFSYLVVMMSRLFNQTTCEQLSYEEWDANYCITTLQGQKCSIH